MSYDRDAFIDKIHEIYIKNKEIEVLKKKRVEDEQAIAVEYKVEECNAKRTKLIKDTQLIITPILAEIKAIEESLLEI